MPAHVGLKCNRLWYILMQSNIKIVGDDFKPDKNGKFSSLQPTMLVNAFFAIDSGGSMV